MKRAENATLCCLPCFLAYLVALPLYAQDDTPFTRLFDTGVASPQTLAGEAIAQHIGWSLVPEDKIDHPFSGDAVLLNDKLAVVLRKKGQGAEVYSRAASGLKHRASVQHDSLAAPRRGGGSGVHDIVGRVPSRGGPVGAKSGPTDSPLALLDSIGALTIVENSSSAVMVEAAAKDKRSAALSFRLTTGEAILEIRPLEDAESVGVQSQAHYVVVPDYFGDDVVFETGPFSPAFRAPAPPTGERDGVRGNLYLPAENFCFHLLDGGEAILMTVWQSSEQDVWLAPVRSAGVPAHSASGSSERAGSEDARLPADRKNDSVLHQIRCLKGKSIWLAFLEAPGLWHAGSTSAIDAWKPPFPAKWRYSLLQEHGVANSWMSEKPDSTGAEQSAEVSPLPPGQTAAKRTEARAPGGPFLVYPIDRSPATPLTVTCPTDVMRNTLGVGPCQYILACEGLAAQGDPTPNSVMTWVEKQFEGKKEKKAAEDIQERLQTMTEHVAHARTRIHSYGDFAGQVRKLLASQQGSESFRPMVDDLDRCVAAGLSPAGSPERAKQMATEVRALIGKENALFACRRLGEPLRSIGAVQDRTLAKCRMAVRRLKQQGRTIAVNQPQEASLAQEVQRLAEQMLQGKLAGNGKDGGVKP